MPKHAYLSASASHRWLACPPSAKLCASIPDQASEYAQQGTDCHELCAYLVKKALGRNVPDPTESLTYYDAEMQNCAGEYRNYVLEQIEAAKEFCKDPQVMIEQRLDFSRWVENGFGTGDCVIVADEELQIIDYKHGLGVLVSAGDDEHGGNSQMICYALGTLEVFGDIYDINQIKMTIFQPRRDNISTYTISRDDLLEWANDVLAPTARLAYVGDGEFKAGDHCQFCKGKATCRKRAEYNLELAKYDFEMPATLDNTEIAAILEKVDEIISWGNDIKEYALKQAQSGVHFEGWKVAFIFKEPWSRNRIFLSRYTLCRSCQRHFFSLVLYFPITDNFTLNIWIIVIFDFLSYRNLTFSKRKILRFFMTFCVNFLCQLFFLCFHITWSNQLQIFFTIMDFCHCLQNRICFLWLHCVEFTDSFLTVKIINRSQVRIQLINNRMEL